jgi:hypothetical protein
VYTSTVNLVSGLRGGKTDLKNHAAAGYAVGALVGKHGEFISIRTLAPEGNV